MMSLINKKDGYTTRKVYLMLLRSRQTKRWS